MLKFIIDTQLPPKLAKFLNQKGFSAIHTTYFPNGHLLDDKTIVEIAVRENLIIITKDSNFLDNYLVQGVPPKILLLQFGNIGNVNLITLFEENLTQIVTMFSNGAEFITFNRTNISEY
jgi:predicted nuclease of predicted toxin-antitoxin system